MEEAVSLENYIAHLNIRIFWKEFTFSQNKFSPKPGRELELADSIVWFGNYAIVLQLKERMSETGDPEAEYSWFEKKVIKKATSQIRDTMRFLREHELIGITNERGHTFEIRGAELSEIKKVVVFRAGEALPDACLQTRYYKSSSEGFIHIVALHDYLGILEKLRLPKDIASYLDYRERVTLKLTEGGSVFDEADIMGAFIGNQNMPDRRSRDNLRRFEQDIEQFDLSWLISDLHRHVKNSRNPNDYYQIMLHFAQIPRSVSRVIKSHLLKVIEVVQKEEFVRPFRAIYPEADCAFMVAPFLPNEPASGSEGVRNRIRALKNLTDYSTYLAKVSRGVGILISKDGKYIQIDWLLIDMPWEQHPEMDAILADRNPFRCPEKRRAPNYLLTKSDL